MVEKIKVVKRNGKKVDFDGSKIALAIKKGFDSVDTPYEADDVNKVYNKVIVQIRKQGKDSIKIEHIQDLIEQELQKNGYNDVYTSFAEYRERRAKSRATFSDEKRLHKFLKVIEKLALKGSNKESNAKETMLKFGCTLAKEFSKTYLIKKVYSDAHENGDIYIHDIEFMPMGTTESSTVDLAKVFKEINLYEVEELLSKLNNEQHGKQIIPALDTYLAPIVLNTFKNEFKRSIQELLEFSDFDKFIAASAIEREIDRLASIQVDIAIFDKYTREAESLKRLFVLAYKNAMKKTEEIMSKEITNFVHRLNKNCIINYGKDATLEGKMISKNLQENEVCNIDFSNQPQYILSTTTINLARLGLKNMGKQQEEFFRELDEKLELIKDQLLERFDEQCSKTAGQFPTLIMQGIWPDGEKLEAQDKLRRVLKQGSFLIGYIGLEECVKALTGMNMEDSELSQKIVKHIKNKTEEFSARYKLNFTYMEISSEKIARRFARNR